MSNKLLKFIVIGQFVAIIILATVYFGSSGVAPNIDNIKNISNKIPNIKPQKDENLAIVNGNRYTQNTKIKYGDTIQSLDRDFTFKVDGDVFKIKPHTTIELKEKTASLNRIVKIITGGVLAAFAKEKKNIVLASYGTIGIRGTALYASVDKQRAYICSCYGKIDIYGKDHNRKVLLNTVEPIGTKKSPYHQAMTISFIQKNSILKADKMHFHTDAELKALEELAGRKIPKKLEEHIHNH